MTREQKDAEWPESFDCRSECGFVKRGIGLQCLEGAACGRYLHPSDFGFAEVSDYYRKAISESQQSPAEVCGHLFSNGGGI